MGNLIATLWRVRLIEDELFELGHEKIIRNGLRYVNPQEFVSWVYDYYKNIEKYLNDTVT